MTDRKLQQALNFTDDDLKANQDGYMTKRQRQLNQSAKAFSIPLIIISGLIGTGILLLILVEQHEAKFLLFASFCFIVAMIGFYGGLSNLRMVKADLEKGVVGKARGTVLKHHDKSIIQIGAKKYIVPQDAYEGFDADKEYIIYHTAHSLKVLSAEKSEP